MTSSLEKKAEAEPNWTQAPCGRTGDLWSAAALAHPVTLGLQGSGVGCVQARGGSQCRLTLGTRTRAAGRGDIDASRCGGCEGSCTRAAGRASVGGRRLAELTTRRGKVRLVEAGAEASVLAQALAPCDASSLPSWPRAVAALAPAWGIEMGRGQ